jgi:hypothetical protein
VIDLQACFISNTKVSDSPPEGNFLAYKARPKESADFVEAIESEPMVVHLPIITLAEKLEILDF